MDVCTIIAKNYLAAARVLGESLREHHPEVRFHVLVVDRTEGCLDPAAEPFEVLSPYEIGLPDFEQMAGIYSILELSTAVKPWLLRHLLERSEDGVVLYLDPDIRLYDRIDDVFDAVREHGLVLTPHNTEPIPRDGKKPSEEDILIAGAYNLGFIGLRRGESAGFVLDWWSERLEHDCVADPANGLFVDQRWIDLVPGLAEDYFLLRDPGFNLAYWNLATREVVERDGAYEVNGVPLRLFHFSGFDPRRPHVLSKYQDRVRLPDEPALAQLCAGYAEALWAAGHERSSRWEYDYDVTASGLRLGPAHRAAYRAAVVDDGLSASLFDPAGERAFLDWCNLPAKQQGADNGVTRFLEVVHGLRDDLQTTYPDLDDPAVAHGFVGWAHVFGSHELPIPAELLPPHEVAGTAVANGAAAASHGPAGVNVAGYLRAELGVGEVARQIIGALDTQRVPLVPVGLHAPNSRAAHDFGADREIAAPFDVNVICVNADGLPAFARQAGPEFFAGRHSIGVWWWELSEFPERHRDAFDLVDEIWVGSRFVADALSVVSPVPVMTFPLPVSVPEVAPDRAALGLPAGFTFLFSFDFNSVFERKNPLGAIEAFERAFGPEDDVHLVVKSINGERDPQNLDRLKLAAAEHPNVHLMSDYLSAIDKERLTASCDAYVSLHRSEGFGIGMAEALLHGKPVVATGYGGNVDFLDETTGYPVRHEPVAVGEGAWPYDPDAHWVEPDVDHAAELMRRVVENPAEAAERARRGGERIRAEHSAEAAGAHLARRLEAIAARRPEPAPAAGAAVNGGASVATPLAKLRRLPRRARQLVRDASAPPAPAAPAVDVEALVREAIADLRRESALAQSADLAELRRLRAQLDALRSTQHETQRQLDELRARVAQPGDQRRAGE